MNRGAKTTTVAKVMMDGEVRVVLNHETGFYELSHKYYDPARNGFRTFRYAKVPTLAQALYMLYSDAAQNNR